MDPGFGQAIERQAIGCLLVWLLIVAVVVAIAFLMGRCSAGARIRFQSPIVTEKESRP